MALCVYQAQEARLLRSGNGLGEGQRTFNQDGEMVTGGFCKDHSVTLAAPSFVISRRNRTGVAPAA